MHRRAHSGRLARALAYASLVMLGCSARSEENAQAPPSASPAPHIDAGLGGQPRNVLFHRGQAAITTGWEGQPEKLSAAYCRTCHEEAHQEWRGGMHSQAWTSPIFQRAYAFERHDWCVHCHAPLRQGDGEEPWADEGINCATCHVRDGMILGVSAHVRTGPDDHHVIAKPYLASAEFCAECHQFNFPRSFDNTVTYSHQPMQNTFAEWKQSGTESCQACHYDGHQLMGPHNAEWMRAQFSDFHSEFTGDELVDVSFRVAARGHVMPTGDLFRSLVFRLASDEQLTKVLYEKRWGRFFGTGWVASNEVSTHALRKNSGLRPGEVGVSLTLDTPKTGPIYGALLFYYHDPFFSGEGKGRDEGSSLRIWSGRLR